MNLYWIRLAQLVGFKRIRNRRSISIRLAVILIIALSIGCVIRTTIHSMVLVAIPAPIRICFSIICLYQAIMMLSIWLISHMDTTKLLGLAQILPMGKWQTNMLEHVPSLVIFLLISVGSLPIITPLCNELGLATVWVIVSCTIGCAGGLGLAYNSWLKPTALNQLIGVTYIGIEYSIIHHSFDAPTCYWPELLSLLLLALACTALIFRRMDRNGHNTSAVHDIYLQRYIPHVLWPGIVVLRNNFTARSFIAAGLLSNGLILIVCHANTPPLAAISPCLALLIAAASGDLRSIHQTSHPPEIAALQGTLKYVLRQFYTALSFGLVLLVPVFCYYASQEPSLITTLACQVCLGAAVGCCAGHMVGMRQRTILTSLLVTTMGCFCLLFLPTRSFFMNLQSWGQATIYLCGAFLFMVIAFAVEYNRNNFIWRSHV